MWCKIKVKSGSYTHTYNHVTGGPNTTIEENAKWLTRVYNERTNKCARLISILTSKSDKFRSEYQINKAKIPKRMRVREGEKTPKKLNANCFGEEKKSTTHVCPLYLEAWFFFCNYREGKNQKPLQHELFFVWISIFLLFFFFHRMDWSLYGRTHIVREKECERDHFGVRKRVERRKCRKRIKKRTVAGCICDWFLRCEDTLKRKRKNNFVHIHIASMPETLVLSFIRNSIISLVRSLCSNALFRRKCVIVDVHYKNRFTLK